MPRAAVTAPARGSGVVIHASIVALLALAWTWPITLKMIDDGDFPTHLAVAQSIVEHPSIPAPHFLFFSAVAAVMAVLPGLSSQAAGLAVVSLLHIGTACLLAWYLRRESRVSSPAVAAVAVLLLVVGPILPWSLDPDQYLVGYFAPNPYHNATFTAGKGFCVWLLLVAGAAFTDPRARLLPKALAAVALTAISKPNFLTCIVPAVTMLAAWRLFTRRPFNRAAVAAMVLLATAAVLVMQVIYGEREMSVVVAPFAALSFFVPIGPTLILQCLGALAFPLVVVGLWPRLLSRPELLLAWGAAVVGFSEAYLLAEAGARMNHGNLLVAASQTVFVLMVASAAALGSLPRPATSVEYARRAVAWAVFALHVVGGMQHVGAKMNLRDWSQPFVYVTLALVAALLVAARLSTPLQPVERARA